MAPPNRSNTLFPTSLGFLPSREAGLLSTEPESPDSKEVSQGNTWVPWVAGSTAALLAGIHIIRLTNALMKRVVSRGLGYDDVQARTAETLKRQFRSLHMYTQIKLKIYDNHSHPTAAQERTHERAMVLNLLEVMGLPYYEIYKGKHNTAGFNALTTPRDLLTQPTELPFDPLGLVLDTEPSFWDDPAFHAAQCVVCVLCDHYIDMVKLMGTGKVIVVIGKNPHRLGYVTADTTTCTLSGSTEKLFVVNGGGRYRHSLHRYDKDHITVPSYTHRSIPVVGPAYQAVCEYVSAGADPITYNIDRFERPEQQFVFMTPLPGVPRYVDITTDLVMDTRLRTIHALLIRRKADEFDPLSRMEEILKISIPGSAFEYEYEYHAFMEAAARHTVAPMDKQALLSHASNWSMQHKLVFMTHFPEVYEFRDRIFNNAYVCATRYYHNNFSPGNEIPPYSKYFFDKKTETVAPKPGGGDPVQQFSLPVATLPASSPAPSPDPGHSPDSTSDQTQASSTPPSSPPPGVISPSRHGPLGWQLGSVYDWFMNCTTQFSVPPQNPLLELSTIIASHDVSSSTPNILDEEESVGDTTDAGPTPEQPEPAASPQSARSSNDPAGSLSSSQSVATSAPSPQSDVPTSPGLTSSTSSFLDRFLLPPPLSHATLPPSLSHSTAVTSSPPPLVPALGAFTSAHQQPMTLAPPAGATTSMAKFLAGSQPSSDVVPLMSLPGSPQRFRPDLSAQSLASQSCLNTRVLPGLNITMDSLLGTTRRGQQAPPLGGVHYSYEVDQPNSQRLSYDDASPPTPAKPSIETYTKLHSVTYKQHVEKSKEVTILLDDMQESLAFNPDYGVEKEPKGGMLAIHPVLLGPEHHLNHYTGDRNSCIDAFHSRINMVNREAEDSYDNGKHLLVTAARVVQAMPFAPTRPMTHEELKDSLTEPHRRKRFLEFESDRILLENPHHRDKLTAFVKAEANDKAVPLSRNITNPPTANLMEMSRFTLPAAAALKHLTPGYLFQHDNSGVASALCRRSQQFQSHNRVATDYSKYDGTQNSLTFSLELMLFKRLFPEDYDEIIKLLTMVKTSPILTGGDYTYASGYTRQSGSAETSVMNTWVNLLIATLAVLYKGYDTLHELPSEIITTPAVEEALQHVLAGGDDGVAFDVDITVYQSLVSQFCLKIELEQKTPHDPVELLGRYYPNPVDSHGSIYAPNRLLTKISYGPKSSMMTVLQMLYYKAIGYYVTDYHSHPVYAEFISGLLRMLAPLQPSNRVVSTQQLAKVQSYMSSGGQSHPLSSADVDVVNSVYATEFGILQTSIQRMQDTGYDYLSYLRAYQAALLTQQTLPPVDTPAAHHFRNALSLYTDIEQDMGVSGQTYVARRFRASLDAGVIGSLTTLATKHREGNPKAPLHVYGAYAGPLLGARFKSFNLHDMDDVITIGSSDAKPLSTSHGNVPDTASSKHGAPVSVKALVKDINAPTSTSSSALFVAILPLVYDAIEHGNVNHYVRNVGLHSRTSYAFVVPNPSASYWLRSMSKRLQTSFKTHYRGVHFSIITTKMVDKKRPGPVPLPTMFLQATKATIAEKAKLVEELIIEGDQQRHFK